MPGEAVTQKTVLEMLESGQCLTIAAMADISGTARCKLVQGAAGLLRRGLVERVETGCYQLTPDGLDFKRSGQKLTSGPNGKMTAPRVMKNTFRKRLWRAMRIRRKFTIGDLIMLSTTGVDKSPKTNAQKYVRFMVRAGYLLEMPRRIPDGKLTSNGLKQYMLSRNNGPAAPVVRVAKKEVYDPNIRQSFPYAGDNQ